MKKDDYIKLFNLVDEKYIAEADPDAEIKAEEASDGVKTEVKTVKRRRIFKYSAIAASIAICITAGGLGLFLPTGGSLPDVSMYADSEYYSLIQKLNVYNYKEPEYKNNFEKLVAGISGLFGGGEDYGAAPDGGSAGGGNDQSTAEPDGSGSSGGGQGESYEEVTDNQTEGVIEADLIKRSDEYIYYMDGAELKVFSIDGENSTMVGKYDFPASITEVGYSQLNVEEFYLSEDCTTVTAITTYYNKEYGQCTSLIALDVTDPENIEEKSAVSVTGDYSSSRVKDGKILLATNFNIYADGIDYSDPSTFVPQIDKGDGMRLLPSAEIISPDKLTSSRFTVVTQYDAATLEAKGASAYVSYSSDFYASVERLYFTRSFTQSTEEDGYVVNTAMTEISCLDYSGDELVNVGSVTVKGSVLNRYSMDEQDGILRVFTTTSWSKHEKNKIYYSLDSIPNANVSLYCIDISDWSTVASVENFAPEGESVRSARFDGDTAYVCTAIQLSDPVFFFDLSDLENITYKHTGTIEGFSTSLIDFGEGYSVGIGVGGNSMLKIEAYVEDGDKVTPLCAYEAEAFYSDDYKAYYIDRENGFIGLGITDYDYEKGERNRYVLLHFNGYEFTEVVNTVLSGDYDEQRGVYVDGYFYMFGKNDFKVEKIG